MMSPSATTGRPDDRTTKTSNKRASIRTLQLRPPTFPSRRHYCIHLFDKLFQVARLHELLHQRGQDTPAVHLKPRQAHRQRPAPSPPGRHRRSAPRNPQAPYSRPAGDTAAAPSEVRRGNRRQPQKLRQWDLAAVAHPHHLLVGGRLALVALVHPYVHEADEGPQVDGPAQVVGRVALAPDRPVAGCRFVSGRVFFFRPWYVCIERRRDRKGCTSMSSSIVHALMTLKMYLEARISAKSLRG